MARRLKTSDDVRRYLASLINRLEAKKIAPEVAGRCAYISSILLRAIETSDIEARLNKLEREVGSK